MKTQWSAESANRWYEKLPWLRGCNFIGSDCANRFDMWQSYRAREKLLTAERELALCQELGFNTVRIWIIFEAWLNEPEFFMEMLESYLTLCADHKLSVMLCLTNEEDLPRGEFEAFEGRKVGEQEYALGYHQGRFPESPKAAARPRWHYAQSPKLAPAFWQMIREIVTRYAEDERILCWNVYNEPGAALDEACVPILERMFQVVRSLDPSQPLTADVWRGLGDNDWPLHREEAIALQNSDIISFHNYQPFPEFCKAVDQFRTHGRPLFCTEWLHRICHNEVRDTYPLMYIANIANYCWGFVVGKTQTNEPWELTWEQYENPDIPTDYDFTKWQHDLFRPSLRPYDPRETELIRTYNRLGDLRFATRQNQESENDRGEKGGVALPEEELWQRRKA